MFSSDALKSLIYGYTVARALGPTHESKTKPIVTYDCTLVLTCERLILFALIPPSVGVKVCVNVHDPFAKSFVGLLWTVRWHENSFVSMW